MGLEELRKSILEKAERKASKIIEDAKEKAKKIIEEAREEYYRRLSKERERALRKLKEEENRKYISKVMELNLELVNLKNRILNEVVSELRRRLMTLSGDLRKESLRKLLKEALDTGIFGSRRVVVKVIPEDIELIKDVIREEGLEDRVASISVIGSEFLGGVIVESEDGSIALDNTYATRLDKVMPKLVEKLNKEVFGLGKQ
ncbi:MAG: hypothetical protein J7L12_04705 [Desulfurococcales archaeon]|nr:hypothetical protein [Desulfurococcales archaeon]